MDTGGAPLLQAAVGFGGGTTGMETGGTPLPEVTDGCRVMVVDALRAFTGESAESEDKTVN